MMVIVVVRELFVAVRVGVQEYFPNRFNNGLIPTSTLVVVNGQVKKLISFESKFGGHGKLVIAKYQITNYINCSETLYGD